MAGSKRPWQAPLKISRGSCISDSAGRLACCVREGGNFLAGHIFLFSNRAGADFRPAVSPLISHDDDGSELFTPYSTVRTLSLILYFSTSSGPREYTQVCGECWLADAIPTPKSAPPEQTSPKMPLAKSKNTVGLGNTLMNDRFGKGKGSDRRKGSAITRTNHSTGEQVCVPLCSRWKCS